MQCPVVPSEYNVRRAKETTNATDKENFNLFVVFREQRAKCEQQLI